MSLQHLVLNSVLKTKITLPPNNPKTMMLKTLNHKLEKAMQYKVILICAPAGYGKSTGVSQFVHRSNRSVVWLTLEETENDPLRFLIYLIAAIQTKEPEFAMDLVDTLQSPASPSVEWLIGCVINKLNELTYDLTFVFDDWHVIHSPVVQQVMDQLIAHLPASMNIVLLTRVYPNFSFNSLRLKQQIIELYTEDFALSKSESLSFFYEVMDLRRTIQQTEVLETLAIKTDGWIAGLQMCGLFLKNSVEVTTESIESLGLLTDQEQPLSLETVEEAMTYQQHLTTHLFMEIFKNLPLQSQVCLMVASVSNRFSVALCNQLLKPFGIEMEETFMRDHLKQGHFMIALDEQNQWFRFHHLYGDFLKTRLHAWLLEGAYYKGVQYDVSMGDLQSTAATWFLNQGLEVEAFQLAAKGDNLDLAARIMQSGEVPLLFRGTAGLALNWLSTVSDTAMNARPWLWIMLATVELYLGKSASTHHYLLHAEQGMSALPPDALPVETVRTMEITMAAIRASVAVINHETDEIESQSTLALKLIGNQFSHARCSALWALGYAKLLKKQMQEALALFEEAVQESERIGHTLVNIMATINIGNVYEEQNLLYEAEKYYFKIFEKADHLGYPVSCDAYLGMSRICFYQNRLVESKNYLETAEKLSHQIDRTDRKAMCYEMAARLSMAERQPMVAFSHIERAIRLATTEKFYHRLESFYELQCQLLIMTGHVRAAQSICKDRHLSMCPVWILAKEERWLDAVEALERRASRTIYLDWPKEQLQMTLLKALCYAKASENASSHELLGQIGSERLGYEEKACEAMRKAVSMAQRGGIVRPFLECGELGTILVEWIETSDAVCHYPDFKDLLYKAIEGEASWEKQPEYDALSPRELEVLKLIAKGLSNEEIAKHLFITLSTVKGTNQRLFAKLQVQRRTEAVVKGKKIGLI